MREVCLEVQVVPEKCEIAFCYVCVKCRVHAVHVGFDGIFNVVSLPVEGGVGVDSFFLVEETVGCFDAVFRHHVLLLLQCLLCGLYGSVVIAQGAHLFLFLAVFIAVFHQVGFHFFRLAVEVAA